MSYVDTLLARSPPGTIKVYGGACPRPRKQASNTKGAGMSGVDDKPAMAGVGHNSKILRSNWYTPSQLGFDEAASANAGPGRNLHRLRVLQSAIFDSRLGIAPLPLKLLSAVLDYGNRESGVAHPGVRTLAVEIYQDLQKLPPEERAAALEKAAGVIMNMFSLLKQCGYDVSKRRAPTEGGRAVAHHALTYPDREEMLAAIEIHERWQEQENARKADSKTKTSPNAYDEVSSPNGAREVTDLTERVTLEGADLTRRGGPDLTRRQVFDPPTHYTEPKSLNLHAGADAPGGEDAGATEELSQNPKVAARSSPKRATPAAAPAAPPADAATAFERFWEVFPPGRKRDKADTRDLFVAIVTGKHKKRRASAEVIVAAAERYAATRPDPQYTPMPSTWLNGGRWEDDDAQPKRQGVPSDEEAELAATLARMRAEEGWQ